MNYFYNQKHPQSTNFVITATEKTPDESVSITQFKKSLWISLSTKKTKRRKGRNDYA